MKSTIPDPGSLPPLVNKVERAVTKPWEPAKKKLNPWRTDYLQLKTTRPGFRARFVRQDNLEKALMKGWQLAERAHYGGVDADLISDGKPTDSRIRRRELILVEMPEELAKDREEYLEGRNRAYMDGHKRQFKDAARAVSREIDRAVPISDDGSDAPR